MEIRDNHIFSLDIEAYSNIYYKRHGYIKGYAFLMKNINAEIGKLNGYYGVHIVDFIYDIFESEKNNLDDTWKKVDKFTRIKDENGLTHRNSKKIKRRIYKRVVYTHNGGRYDYHFFLPIFNLIFKKDKRFSLTKIFFSKKNEILSLIVSFKDKNIARREIEFRDSYKIFPLSLAILGKSINLNKLDYGEYDIANEYNNWEEFIEEENNLEYLIRDVDILSKMLLKAFQIIGFKNWKLTIASTATKIWYEFIGEEKYHYLNYSKWKKFNQKNKEEEKGNLFDIEDWLVGKKAFHGGITYVNPKYQFKKLKNIYKYDINSLYPSVMVEKMPYGRIYKGNRLGTTYKILKVDIKIAKVKKGKMPFVSKVNLNLQANIEEKNELNEESFNDIDLNQYPKELFKITKYMNNYEYAYFSNTYFGEWKAEVLLSAFEKESPFKSYINHWMEIKEKSDDDKAMRQIAKLFLNSLYGKQAQKQENDIINEEEIELEKAKEKFQFTDKAIWYEGDDKRKRKVIKNNSTYIYIKGKDDNSITNAKYIFIADKITTLARLRLLKAINNNFNNFVYCDTDSIHLLDKAKEIELDKTKLGAWKYEGLVKEAIYRRPKHYLNLKIDDNSDRCNLFYLVSGGFNKKEINNNPKVWKKFIKLYFNEREFIWKNGKTMSEIVNGGPLIKNIDYKFSMPFWF